MSLPAGGAESRRGGGGGDTETGQRHRDTRTERGGDVERYRDTQQGGRTELSLQGEWIWTWECAEEVGL